MFYIIIIREIHLESHKMNENRKLENEYMLKQMFWDNNKMYKESVEEYERKQKHLEQLRAKQHQQFSAQYQTDPMKICVAGEPAFQVDSRGNTLFNKMRQIDENFDDIQVMVKTLNIYTFSGLFVFKRIFCLTK